MSDATMRRAAGIIDRVRRRAARGAAPGTRLTAAQVAATGLFDAAWYAARNPDVVTEGGDALDHFLHHGAAEGRDPGPRFDGASYLSDHPDVAASELSAFEHYALHGRDELRLVRAHAESGARTDGHAPAPAPVQSPDAARAAIVLRGIPRSATLLEIGGSHHPLVPRSQGWDTTTVDHADRLALVAKYRDDATVDTTRIEDVDHVWTHGELAALIPVSRHGRFDRVIASHVLEHLPDPIGFLASVEQLLGGDGELVLALPDRRYCYDHFRAATTTADWIEARDERRTRHAERAAFDSLTRQVRLGDAVVWDAGARGRYTPHVGFRAAVARWRDYRADGTATYVDMHAWMFTPSSFALLMLELNALAIVDLAIDELTPAMGCEFLARLRRGGIARAAALDDAALDRERMRLLRSAEWEAAAPGAAAVETPGAG